MQNGGKKWRCAVTAFCLLSLVLVACGQPSASFSSPSVSAAREPSVQPASQPEPPSYAYAPLPALNLSGIEPAALDATSQDWWVGTDVNEDNVPLHCAEAQAQFGALGLVATGPEPDAVYLTFDFGYETGFSGQILDTLADRGAKGTFFLVQRYMEQEQDSVRRMIDEGHSVGNHSISHPGGPGGVAALGEEQQKAEIGGPVALLQTQYDYPCRLFRYPEGVYSEKSLYTAASLGQYSIFWSYAYKDWDAEDQPNEAEALQKALDAAHGGAVYLLHPQKTNADMLGALIDGLRAKGYEPKAL